MFIWDIMLEKVRKFYKGAFDYDSPSAGCGCCGIEADPHMAKKYKGKKR